MSEHSSLADLLQRGDLDELVREVDRLSNVGDWDAVLLLRDRCMEAAETVGKQLWGVAQYAEYRTALEAPGPVAAEVVVPGAARFALGPLTEVIAQQHRFVEVADHLDTLVIEHVAQERALRGEDLRHDPRAATPDGAPTPVLEPWEPRYRLPTYRENEVLAPSPPLPDGTSVAVTGAPGGPATWPEMERALEDLAAPWETHSTGEVHVAVVEGTAGSAVAALLPGAASIRPVSLPEAFAWMQWAAASGGARGRRRGGAAGRAAVWWLGHVATRLPWPADPDELEFHLEDLRWYLFEEVEGDHKGWRLRMAIEDPADGWAVAIDAHDVSEEDEDDA